jgi:outer membrane receptor protein involved in Fe transport
LQLIVDGVEFNETLYGTTQLGHHIPADAIAEVEIIRGPGSAKYGGTAELAVVRVTTKGAAQNGGYGVVTPSFADGKLGMDYNGGFGYTKGDWRMSANAFVGENFRSNKRYTAQDGSSFDMTHDSDIASRMVNVGLGWKDFDARVIYDKYELTDRVNFGMPLPVQEEIQFETLAVMAKYDWRVKDWLTLTPSFTYQRQTPWHGGVAGSTFEDQTTRYIAELSAVVNLSENAALLAGFRYHRDEAVAKDTSFYGVAPTAFYNNGTSDHVCYDTVSPYAQLDWDLKWVNVTLGGRYEYHSEVGGQFVPRIGLTKAWDRFHVKALFDQAYRTPNINIINSPLNVFSSALAKAAPSSEVKSEKTTSYQIEAGYLFDHGFSLVGNLYYMEIEDPIVYMVDAGTSNEGYANGGKISTYGTELELRYTCEKFSGSLGYSFYALGQNTVPVWQSGVSRLALGIPAHKVSASGTWHITDHLNWNLNGTLTAEELAYTDTSGQSKELDPTFLLNTFVEYRWKHASIGLGVANLFDDDNQVAQPYDGGAAPMLLKGREIFFKLGFEF